MKCSITWEKSSVVIQIAGLARPRVLVGARFNIWSLKSFLRKIFPGGKKVPAAQIVLTTVTNFPLSALVY
jgi:hypothetical protein